MSLGPALRSPHQATFELRPLLPRSLESIVAGRVPGIRGLAVLEGSLPPVHVAARSLHLLRAGCPAVWALPFSIIALSHNAVVGGCGFKGLPALGSVEIGYGVAGAFRCRGAASWAVRTMVQRAIASGIVQSVVAHIVPGNVASEILVSRIGFQAGALVADSDGEEVVRWCYPIVS